MFKRRNPKQSQISRISSSSKLYDFIRMLDAEGYPKAFIENGAFRYEFSNAKRFNGHVTAQVTIVSQNTPKISEL